MDTTTSARTHRAPQSRWRLALLITVLTGFFLIHGLSGADACVGAAASLHSGVESTTASSVTATTGMQATAAGTEASPAATSADQCCASTGTLCIPLRPQDTTWLLVMLLLGLALLSSGGLAERLFGAAARDLRARQWPSGAITPVRLLACVSRT